jgi:uracil-DNA glycosylase
MTAKPPAAPLDRRLAARAWLDWYAAMGVGDPLPEPPAPAPPQRDAAPEASRQATPAARPPPTPVAPSPGPTIARPERAARQPGSDRVAWARSVAAECRTLGELRAALETFEGCPLKATATRLCFADGAEDARLMLVGEAPGADEDRVGRPFVGQSGQLLDRILATVGLDRTRVYIANCIYWRPPGNRSPTTAEMAVCQPFLERQIELLAPRLILFLGGAGARNLLGLEEGVTRSRGRPYTYQPTRGAPIPARVTFHPAYLLRQPIQKRFVWRDLLQVRAELEAGAPRP